MEEEMKKTAYRFEKSARKNVDALVSLVDELEKSIEKWKVTTIPDFEMINRIKKDIGDWCVNNIRVNE